MSILAQVTPTIKITSRLSCNGNVRRYTSLMQLRNKQRIHNEQICDKVSLRTFHEGDHINRDKDLEPKSLHSTILPVALIDLNSLSSSKSSQVLLIPLNWHDTDEIALKNTITSIFSKRKNLKQIEAFSQALKDVPSNKEAEKTPPKRNTNENNAMLQVSNGSDLVQKNGDLMEISDLDVDYLDHLAKAVDKTLQQCCLYSMQMSTDDKIIGEKIKLSTTPFSSSQLEAVENIKLTSLFKINASDINLGEITWQKKIPFPELQSSSLTNITFPSALLKKSFSTKTTPITQQKLLCAPPESLKKSTDPPSATKAIVRNASSNVSSSKSSTKCNYSFLSNLFGAENLLMSCDAYNKALIEAAKRKAALAECSKKIKNAESNSYKRPKVINIKGCIAPQQKLSTSSLPATKVSKPCPPPSKPEKLSLGGCKKDDPCKPPTCPDPCKEEMEKLERLKEEEMNRKRKKLPTGCVSPKCKKDKGCKKGPSKKASSPMENNNLKVLSSAMELKGSYKKNAGFKKSKNKNKKLKNSRRQRKSLQCTQKGKSDSCGKGKEKKQTNPCSDEHKEYKPKCNTDPCKKDAPTCGGSNKKKADAGGCGKKDGPCKRKNDPCKKKEDPCKKKDPCKKEDPCKKKDPCKKEDPCKKKDPCKKEDPCKKKEDPCKKKDPCGSKKEDPCKKKDPCKKEDPCKKKDPCGSKKEDPCKKKDPCKKEDPCKKKDPCKKEDPCKKKDPCGSKKEDPCKKKPSSPCTSKKASSSCGVKKSKSNCGKTRGDTKPSCKKSYSTLTLIGNHNADLPTNRTYSSFISLPLLKNDSLTCNELMRQFSSKKSGNKGKNSNEMGQCSAIATKTPTKRKPVFNPHPKDGLRTDCFPLHDMECKKLCKESRKAGSKKFEFLKDTDDNKRKGKDILPFYKEKKDSNITKRVAQLNNEDFTHEDYEEVLPEKSGVVNESVCIGNAGVTEKQVTEIPSISDYDILIRTNKIAISDSDIYCFENGFNSGITLGHDAAGIVVDVGRNVKNFKPGDRVVVESGISCGICNYCKVGTYNMCSQLRYNGFFTKYQAHPADLCFKIPHTLSITEGALIQTLALGCQAVFTNHITPVSNVLIMGCSSTAVACALCAHAIGAKKVVLTSTIFAALESIRKTFGFNYVHYNENSDPAEQLESIFSLYNDWPDVVINCAINDHTMTLAVTALKPSGCCVLTECDTEHVKFNAFDAVMKNVRLITSFRSNNMFPIAINLISSGRAPIGKIISSVFSWDSIDEAFRLAQNASNCGYQKVIVHCGDEESLSYRL